MRKTRRVHMHVHGKSTKPPDEMVVKADGSIAFRLDGNDLDITSSVVVSYDRLKGAKILARVPITKPTIVFDPYVALTNFDLLVAIDTNTSTMQSGDRLSVGCLFACTLSVKDCDLHADFGARLYFAGIDLRDEPELLGWQESIRHMNKQLEISGKRVGVVVDAYLDDLPSFNARSRALPDGSMLPNGLELIYGSADVGKDHVAPLLISRCNRAANRLMKWLLDRDVDKIIPKKDHLFFWRPERERLLPLPDELTT